MMDIYAYIRRPVTEEDMRFERGLNDLEPEKKKKRASEGGGGREQVRRRDWGRRRWK